MFTEITKEKMKQAKLKNPTRYWLGKQRSDMIGDKNPAKRQDVREKIKNQKIGKKLFPNHIENIRKSHIGHIVSNITKIKLSKPKSYKTKENMSKALKGKYIGEKSWNWKGGLTPEMLKIRNSIEYNDFRQTCFKRDNFTCQKYGIRGGKLVVHHIYNFSNSPELRLNINNGITLSDKAHREFHKIYGKKNNTREQLEEFLKN